MPSAESSADTRRRAALYWEQSRSDHAEARRRWKHQAFLQCDYLSLQAALNGLASVCHLHGHVRIPNFSAVQLAGLCAEADGRFGDAALLRACHELERVQERGPFDPEPPPREQRRGARRSLDHSARVLDAVARHLKECRLL